MNVLNHPRYRHLAVVVVLALVGNLLVLIGGPSPLTAVAGLTVICLLPGYLLAHALFPRRDAMDGVERGVFSLALGFAGLILGGLLLHYVPGPVTPTLVLGAFNILLVILLIIVGRREPEGEAIPVPRDVLIHVALVLLVSALLRLPNLGYAEFQGDEATILLKAAAAVEGRTDAIFVHKKGPAEIVVPTMMYGMIGRMTETVARLPFALATIAGLLALYQLGRSMFNPFVGLIAALLLSVNGFFVGFGRIVQYQGIVFLASAMALLCAYRFYQGREPSRRTLFLSAWFVALGMLAHYDAVFVGLALALLVLLRWAEERERIGRDVATLVGAVVVGTAMLAAFFVPMSQHPYFREATLPYLFDVRVGSDDGMLHNTLDNSLLLTTFYNSTYYMAFMALTLLAGIAHYLWRTGSRWVGAALTAVFLAGAVLLVARPDVWQLGTVNVSFFFLAAFTLILVVSRAPTPEWKAVLLWFAAGFIFYATLVRSPRTHIHVAFPAWCVLSACALDELRVRLPSPTWRRAAGAGFAVLYAVFAIYIYLVFVQHDVLYKRAYPEAKPPGYVMVSDELPRSGWFGFPYRAGWKMIGDLYGRGELQGTYWSNEEELITDWYTRGAPRCDQDPRYYFIADDVQDVRDVPADLEAAGYGQIGSVVIDGREPIRIYERGADGTDPIVRSADGSWPTASNRGSYLREQLMGAREPTEAFDVGRSGTAFEPGLPYADQLGYVQQPLDVQLDDKARLRGFALESDLLLTGDDTLAPGEPLVVTLYWSGLTEMDKDYSVFVHLVDADDAARGVAQSDGAPELCGDVRPTTTWTPGRIVVDRHELAVPADLSPGRYALLAGLYDYETLERLNVLGPDGTPVDSAVRLGEITVDDGP